MRSQSELYKVPNHIKKIFGGIFENNFEKAQDGLVPCSTTNWLIPSKNK